MFLFRFEVKYSKFRKPSCYSKQKIGKVVTRSGGGQGIRVNKKTLADRIGIKAKKKEVDCQETESLEYIADTIEDQDTTIKEDEVIYYKAKKIVPRHELKLGMER